MAHFIDAYSDLVNEILHEFMPATWFYRQEVYEVTNLVTALIITHDDVRADSREYNSGTTWEQFLARMCRVKADWKDLWTKASKEKRDADPVGGEHASGLFFYGCLVSGKSCVAKMWLFTA